MKIYLLLSILLISGSIYAGGVKYSGRSTKWVGKYNKIDRELRQIKDLEEEIKKEKESKDVSESRIKRLEKRIESSSKKIDKLYEYEAGKIEKQLKYQQKRFEKHKKSGKNTERVEQDIAAYEKELKKLQKLVAQKDVKEKAPADKKAAGDKSETKKTDDKKTDDSKDGKETDKTGEQPSEDNNDQQGM